ncbi:MAG TPA: oxalate/formate MFS antiporter [Myxococcales bacterium]|jgi:OFA family oxalate/formate antiporter-like MFS transporter
MQLILGVLCMVQIANLQYGWTLFVNPINQKYHWGRAAIQVAFSVFVIAETWLVPVEGWLVDRFGPKAVVLAGGALVGVSWVMNSYASTLTVLYIAAAIGGTGAGAVYGTAVGNSLKWFPDKRGLAAGITAAGFGAGAALTVVPIDTMIKSAGYEAAFFRFGIAQGLLVLLFGFFLRAPRPGDTPAVANTRVLQTTHESSPGQALKAPTFWIMYAMFVMVAMGGLMATAQLSPIARDFKVADVPVTLLGLTLPALPFALSIDRVLNGLTRPFFGWVSDHLGRENTMFIAFLLEGAGILLLLQHLDHPKLFVILSGVVFFAWGEIYSLFPATCADLYGRKYCTTIYGLLYTAKGTASLLVPVANVWSKTNGWSGVFYAAAALNFAASLCALLILKPATAKAHRTVLPDALGITRV